MFTPEDVIQIQIINMVGNSHCIQLKPIDLPLTINGSYTHFVQIGETSQLKLSLDYRQSEKLIAEENKIREKLLEEIQGKK